MSTPFVVHVVDQDASRRAQIARCAFSMGHHAEVYGDAGELAAHGPTGGLVIALEGIFEGGVGELMGLLNQDGGWLAVVVTCANPTIENVVAAISHGALDYLQIPIDPDRLRRTIAKAANEAPIRGEQGRRRHSARQRLAALTPRERDVLKRMAHGMTNKEIGLDLRISPRTIEIHRGKALAKLSARHSAEALRVWFESEMGDGYDAAGLP